jgi:cytochrome c553
MSAARLIAGVSPSLQVLFCAQVLLFAIAAIAGSTGSSAFADERIARGAEIYRIQCAECHGGDGMGVSTGYPAPLAGEKSLDQLVRSIERTMPEGEPEKCVGDEARAVAEYIYAEFYSPVAQARRQPPRIELSRLTVRQHRNTLTDLVASFRDSGAWTSERGLKARYYKADRPSKEELAFERVDSTVNFDFGEASPGEGIPADGFAIRWEGGVFAPETGEYEFRIRTDNGVRLWVNDNDAMFIDGGVRSGSDIEHKRSIFLLGGRAYSLRLEMFKSKKGKETRARVALWWKRPHGEPELIPTRVLSPGWFPDQFVASTSFPPDDRSMGFERGTSVSRQWDEATTDAAFQTAAYVVQHLRRLAGLPGDGSDRKPAAIQFCRQFVERAFRRPLTESEVERIVARPFATSDDVDAAVKLVVIRTLKSPSFLFREPFGEPNDPHNVASRLSYALWDSMPDAELSAAARQGRLNTPEAVREQAWRMVGHSRARAKLREFLWSWLRLDHLPPISKDESQFPDFNPAVVADLRESLELQLDKLVNDDAATLHSLLLSDGWFVNGRLAKLYGGEAPADADFTWVSFPAERRGILSHPYLLAGFAYTSSSSPIHRGLLISRSFLGRVLRPPPEAIAPAAPSLFPNLTTRERTALQTQAVLCQSCHGLINPLGFTLENFDAIGRYRAEEAGKPVDASGFYLTRNGDEAKVNGPVELANFLAASDEVHSAFVQQLFHTMVKQPIRAHGPSAADRLSGIFSERGLNLRSLLVEIAVHAAWWDAATIEQNAQAASPVASNGGE